MLWRKFPALGTEIIICASLNQGEDDLLDAAEREVREFERRFSRFLPASELSQWNQTPVAERKTSPMLADLLKTAEDYSRITGGIFNVNIIDSLEAVGYDRSFDQLEAEKNISGNIIEQGQRAGGQNKRIDLGGIGKGYIIDYLSEHLFAKIDNYWLSAGGDLIVKGHEPGKVGWRIGIQDPNNQEADILHIETSGEKLAIATSGILKRQGIKNGEKWHHLIDPRTGRPADNNILAVTVIADRATAADVYAKTVLILGEYEGKEFIERQVGAAAIIFPASREPIYSQKAGNYAIIKNIN